MRKLFLSRPEGASRPRLARGIFVCFVLEGENGGQVEVRGVPGPSRSSAVHSPSSRAHQSARQGEFFSFVVSGPATACWSGVFFVFFCGRSRSTRRGFLWALYESTYSAGRSSSGNAQSGDVEPA